MIGRVAIDGTDLDLADVFASVTIRHGRGGVDDGPLASSSSLRLVNVDRAFAAAFRTEVELGIYLEDDAPRFVGKVTDAKLNEDGLSIIATSSLGAASSRTIGEVDWPEETWSVRIRRAFNEAGLGSTWSVLFVPWSDPSLGTWAAPLDPMPLTIEIGDDDPIVSARGADPTTLGAYLGTLIADESAAIANLPDGTVLVQALSYRKGLAETALDPDFVAFAPEWEKVSDVVNAAKVQWAGGDDLYVVNEISLAEFELSEVTIATDLTDEADAERRGRQTVSRGGVSDWLVGDVELLELDATIGIGTPLRITELPAWAPVAERVGIVEGWTDLCEVNPDGELEWSSTFALSAPRLSGYGLTWADVPTGLAWSSAGVATWYAPESLYE